jgi:hypothetical protein
MSGCTWAVGWQRLGKNVPVARQQIFNNITAGLQQCKSCFLSGPCRDVANKEQGYLRVSSVQESVRTELEPEEEE